MKKIILATLVASTMFISCGSDDDSGNDSCISCSTSVAGFDTDTTVCDNNNGTYTVKTTVKIPVVGDQEIENTFDFEEGEELSDLDCEDLAAFGDFSIF